MVIAATTRWLPGTGLLPRTALLLALLLMVAAGSVQAAPAEVVRSADRSTGAVALTFDDGWGADACEKISRTLRKHGATATFFINGNYIKLDRARWRKILKGMTVGNHTRSHRNLVTESDLVARKQIKQNEKLHEKVLGRPMLKVLRPPFGAYDNRVRRIAADLGYEHLVLWNITAADTSSGATVDSIVRRTTGARPGSIILMHCARDITVEALPRIVSHYQDRGIELVGLDELLGIGRVDDVRVRTDAKPVPAPEPMRLGEALQRFVYDWPTRLATAMATFTGAGYG